MPSVPLKAINKLCCLGNGHIFIISGLKADNETEEEFENNAVIDSYNIRDGEYEGSFYIPGFRGKKITDFWISKSMVVLLAGEYIKVFRLDYG